MSYSSPLEEKGITTISSRIPDGPTLEKEEICLYIIINFKRKKERTCTTDKKTRLSNAEAKYIIEKQRGIKFLLLC